jgi:hypothetical protein
MLVVSAPSEEHVCCYDEIASLTADLERNPRLKQHHIPPKPHHIQPHADYPHPRSYMQRGI